MSTSTSTSTPAPSAPTKKPPTPGQGILVPASKVHTSVKTELLNTLSQAEFSENTGRIPKLVGILATDKEDAANYAEVSTGSGLLAWGSGWAGCRDVGSGEDARRCEFGSAPREDRRGERREERGGREGGLRSLWSFKEADDVLFILLLCLFLSCYRYSDLRTFGTCGSIPTKSRSLELTRTTPSAFHS